ncbi:DUF6573 family protein [Streptomyces sp. NPDC004286]|uniref:DUF6573 family protein n=1 Tax=Streptomyces sp. NPDC004286 TaxID=3364696 RepID=UPI00368B2476
MATIRRNWTKRVAEIRAAVRGCHAYDSDSGTMVSVDPARAFEEWHARPRARLTEDIAGEKWTVHVHSNLFFVLTTEGPDAKPSAAAVPAPRLPDAPAATIPAQRVPQEAPAASIPAQRVSAAVPTDVRGKEEAQPSGRSAGQTAPPAEGEEAAASARVGSSEELVIDAYSRAQAIADGVLVELDADFVREAGYVVPVALTRAVWEDCVAWSEGDSERQLLQHEFGRLWDILIRCRAAIRSGSGGSRVTFGVRRVPRDGRSLDAQEVVLVCVMAAGDDPRPVITIMQPDES